MPRDLPLRRKDGTFVQLESVFNNLLGVANVGGIVVTARDVTERKALEEQLPHQAFHDALTGLANRALFSDRSARARARTCRRHASLAVLFIDLDDFKTVNDSLGHAAGDELLVAVAEPAARASCGRTTPSPASAATSSPCCSRTSPTSSERRRSWPSGSSTRCRAARRSAGTEVSRAAASIGIAIDAARADAADELLRNADVAMYTAKATGKGRLRVFEPGDARAASSSALELEGRPRSAPSTPTSSRALPADRRRCRPAPGRRRRGAGALAAPGARAACSPGDFIPLAEETGLIVPTRPMGAARGVPPGQRAGSARGHPASVSA